MASVISLCFVSGPLWSSRGMFFKEGHLRNAALSILPTPKTSSRVTHFHNMCSSSKGKFPASHGCHNALVVPLNMFAGMIPCLVAGSSCNQITITGYWVGPDIDDGWGFVDALTGTPDVLCTCGYLKLFAFMVPEASVPARAVAASCSYEAQCRDSLVEPMGAAFISRIIPYIHDRYDIGEAGPFVFEVCEVIRTLNIAYYHIGTKLLSCVLIPFAMLFLLQRGNKSWWIFGAAGEDLWPTILTYHTAEIDGHGAYNVPWLVTMHMILLMLLLQACITVALGFSLASKLNYNFMLKNASTTN